MQYSLGAFFIALAFLPWVNFGLTTLDTQPWSLIAATLFIFSVNRFQITKISQFFLIAISMSLLLAIVLSFGSSLFLLFRGMASYLSFIVSFVGMYIYLKRYGIPIKLVIALNTIWLLAAIPQLIVDPLIYEKIIQVRTTPNRGVNSLAAEPTFFALFLIFSSWILFLSTSFNPNKIIKFIIGANILSIIFIAQSAMGVVYLIIAALGVFVALDGQKKTKFFLMLPIITPLIIIFAYHFLDSSRLVGLIKIASDGLFIVVERDASINGRVAHAVLPFFSSGANLGIPGGLDSFGKEAEIINNRLFDGYFYRNVGGNKIMSYLGAFFFELGLFAGILLISFIFYCIGVKNKPQIAQGLILCIFLVGAIPVNFALVPLLLAIGLFQRKQV